MRSLWALRIGFAMCFIGHGAFGLLQKRDWLPFFGEFGVDQESALSLMPLVGSVDIAVGLAGLFLPLRVVFLYGFIWCGFTAALRPLTGQSMGEFIERAGNYGVPLALLVLTTGQRWFTRITATPDAEVHVARIATVCRWTTALLLAGHGWLALQGKPLLQQHLSLVGGGSLLRPFGVLELALSAACLMRPSRSLFLGIVGWKLFSEGLFVFAGAPVWEFIERGGSYVAPLVAAMLTREVAAVHRTRPAQAAAAIALWLTLAPVMFAQAPPGSAPAQPSLAPALLDELRQGGLVVACRHAITSHAQEDRMPVNFDDPSTQRVLSPEGEAQATALGKSLSSLKIPFNAVLASPYQRTRRSAELMTGAVQIDDALSSSSKGKDAELKALMTGTVPAGGNRLLVTHQGLLYRSFPSVKHGSVAEGDCLVVRPAASGAEVLAMLKPTDWK